MRRLENLVANSNANHHKANRAIQQPNGTLRVTYDILRSANHWSRLEDLVLEATCSKNLNRGSKLASAFELLHVVWPCIPERMELQIPTSASIDAQHTDVANVRIDLMLQKPPHRSNLPNPEPHLLAYF